MATLEDAGVTRSFSESPPFSYILKVESFSLLVGVSMAETNVKCESGVFGAGGYNWKLVFYPNGNKKKNVKDHISLYLVKAGENSLQPGEGVYVDFRLFLLDQIKSKYLVIEGNVLMSDIGPPGRDWGWAQFIRLEAFRREDNGYLRSDTCFVEAEFTVATGTAMVLNTLGKNDTDIQEDGNDVQRFSKGSHILSAKKTIMKKSSNIRKLIICQMFGH